MDQPADWLTDLPTNQPKIIIKSPIAWTKINYSVNWTINKAIKQYNWVKVDVENTDRNMKILWSNYKIYKDFSRFGFFESLGPLDGVPEGP